MVNKLTLEEKELVESYENDEWESVLSEQSQSKYAQAARATFKKDKRVNIRMPDKGLE